MNVHEYLRILVFVNKLVSYEYFMDEIQEYELELLFENIGWTYKNEWEIARLESYCSLCAFGKPKKTMQEMIPLMTDKNEDYNVVDDNIDTNDYEKVMAQQKYIMNMINGHTNKN